MQVVVVSVEDEVRLGGYEVLVLSGVFLHVVSLVDVQTSEVAVEDAEESVLVVRFDGVTDHDSHFARQVYAQLVQNGVDAARSLRVVTGGCVPDR